MDLVTYLGCLMGPFTLWLRMCSPWVPTAPHEHSGYAQWATWDKHRDRGCSGKCSRAYGKRTGRPSRGGLWNGSGSVCVL